MTTVRQYTAMDHATQAEIRLATMYAISQETEQLLEAAYLNDYDFGPQNGLPALHARRDATWVRRDRFLNALTEAAAELELDLELIFDVARQIQEA